MSLFPRSFRVADHAGVISGPHPDYCVWRAMQTAECLRIFSLDLG
jgi:hypothetical protein